jgi:hypothetical protein
MSISKFVLAGAVLLYAATAGAVAPRCNLNPGGPEELLLTVPQAGSDFDLGWKGTVHDYDVPGGARFALCLTDCDNDTDPNCLIQGQAEQLSAAGRAFAPPIPVVIGTVAVCVQANFANPAVTGNYNLETGAISATATLNAQVYLTAQNNVCPQCVSGTCNGGGNNGGACTVGETITVQGAVGDTTYDVSIDCPPSGGLSLPVPLTVDVTTGTDSQGPCPNQEDTDDCGAGTCTLGNCTGPNDGGISQACCSNNTTKPCFPNPVSRTGTAAPVLPQWPDPSYPKSEDTAASTLVSTFCTQGAPPLLGDEVNDDAGLPGPVAFILPLDQEVFGDTDSDGLPDTFDGCTHDGDCDDDGLLDGSLGPEDANNDGVVDAGETDNTTGDSDGDGLGDGLERGLETPQSADTGGTFVGDADANTTTDPLNADTDGDGLDDGEEDANENGRVDDGESDPNDPNDPGGPVGGCSSPGECNDDDPCTDDSCPADTCVFTPRTGSAGVQCKVDGAQSGPICGTDPLDKKTDKAVTNGLKKLDGLLAKLATATGNKKTKLLKKANAAVNAIKKKAAKAAGKSKISAACGTTIADAMNELSALLATI